MTPYHKRYNMTTEQMVIKLMTILRDAKITELIIVNNKLNRECYVMSDASCILLTYVLSSMNDFTLTYIQSIRADGTIKRLEEYTDIDLRLALHDFLIHVFIGPVLHIRNNRLEVVRKGTSFSIDAELTELLFESALITDDGFREMFLSSETVVSSAVFGMLRANIEENTRPKPKKSWFTRLKEKIMG